MQNGSLKYLRFGSEFIFCEDDKRKTKLIIHTRRTLYEKINDAIQGQILAVAERNSEYAIIGEETVTGNVMQFCLHYGEGNEEKVRKAYEVLKTDAKILMPLAPCEFSSLMADFIDKYGIRWCLFI